MSEEKKVINNEELENVNGGYGGGGGFYMTVGNCNGSYLALRPQPYWDQYHELYQLYPGYQVFTYGETTNGTGLNGTPCTYRFVPVRRYLGLGKRLVPVLSTTSLNNRRRTGFGPPVIPVFKKIQHEKSICSLRYHLNDVFNDCICR